MKIRTPEDPAPKTTWSRKNISTAGIVIGILWWLVIGYLATLIFTFNAAGEAGLITIDPVLRGTLALGLIILGFTIPPRIITYIDEQILGRTRVTYIRETGTESSNRVEAIAEADKIVETLMKTISKKREDSTIESRTNLIHKTENSTYRVTTIVTVLIAGMEIAEDEIPHDLSLEQPIH